jgi:hypothetical protein
VSHLPQDYLIADFSSEQEYPRLFTDILRNTLLNAIERAMGVVTDLWENGRREPPTSEVSGQGYTRRHEHDLRLPEPDGYFQRRQG